MFVMIFFAVFHFMFFHAFSCFVWSFRLLFIHYLFSTCVFSFSSLCSMLWFVLYCLFCCFMHLFIHFVLCFCLTVFLLSLLILFVLFFSTLLQFLPLFAFVRFVFIPMRVCSFRRRWRSRGGAGFSTGSGSCATCSRAPPTSRPRSLLWLSRDFWLVLYVFVFAFLLLFLICVLLLLFLFAIYMYIYRYIFVCCPLCESILPLCLNS